MSESAFLEQLRSNQGIIYKLVSLYAADSEDRKDLYQEIVLQAWKSWRGYRGDSKFSTWLYRVSLNTILTQKRKSAKADKKDSFTELQDVRTTADDVNHDLKELQWAIRRLSETDRAIISMNLDGYDNSEIADIVGITNNNVAVKLHRIKQQLANILKAER
ncbi:MAG: sigma-70 family RNA polymerase sigma factor [Chitinophagaceae bacterium]|nr:sigma-70 family RNA polymerase sigma factor [Chitinophagaceae bacterium]